MTKDELKQLRGIKKLIDYKKRELQELEELSTCVPALNTKEKVQVSIINKGMPLSDKKIDLERQIEKDIDRLISLQKEAYTLIQGLPPRDRLLIEARYIKAWSWSKVCEETNYSWNSVHRHHRRILQELFPNN